MSVPADSMHSPERLRAYAIATLTPFFVDGPQTDVKTARNAAKRILDDYKTATPRELQLATQIIALGWGALACLRTAAAAKNLSIEQTLDLQDDAIGLNRSSMQATQSLEARQKERAKNPSGMSPENTKWDEGIFQLSINRALDKYNEANATLAAYMATFESEEPKPKRLIRFAKRLTPLVPTRRAKG